MSREEERKTNANMAQTVIIKGREHITVGGVLDVDSFNENEIQLVTELGLLTIIGESMHISRLNLDDGQLVVEGYFAALEYSDQDNKKHGSLFSRLFG